MSTNSGEPHIEAGEWLGLVRVYGGCPVVDRVLFMQHLEPKSVDWIFKVCETRTRSGRILLLVFAVLLLCGRVAKFRELATESACEIEVGRPVLVFTARWQQRTGQRGFGS